MDILFQIKIGNIYAKVICLYAKLVRKHTWQDAIWPYECQSGVANIQDSNCSWSPAFWNHNIISSKFEYNLNK